MDQYNLLGRIFPPIGQIVNALTTPDNRLYVDLLEIDVNILAPHFSFMYMFWNAVLSSSYLSWFSCMLCNIRTAPLSVSGPTCARRSPILFSVPSSRPKVSGAIQRSGGRGRLLPLESAYLTLGRYIIIVANHLFSLPRAALE